jgi:hypothetical protein
LVKTVSGLSLIPSRVPPTLDFLMSIGKTVIGGIKTQDDDNYYNRRYMNEGIKGMKRGARTHFIPAYGQLRKMYSVAQPEVLSQDAEAFLGLSKKKKPWTSLLLPTSAREHKEMETDLGL